jgi:hypothetical protein
MALLGTPFVDGRLHALACGLDNLHPATFLHHGVLSRAGCLSKLHLEVTRVRRITRSGDTPRVGFLCAEASGEKPGLLSTQLVSMVELEAVARVLRAEGSPRLESAPFTG